MVQSLYSTHILTVQINSIGIKDNDRLQSIIRHSLQPVENPDTVLMIPAADGQDEENWADSEGSSTSTQELTKGTASKDRKNYRKKS